MRPWIALILLAGARPVAGQAVPAEAGREPGEIQFWFSRDDYAIDDPDAGDRVKQFAPDTLSKWDDPKSWSGTLAAMDVYVLQSYLFHRGRPVADGFADLCLKDPSYPPAGAGDRVEQCYDEYLKRMLTVLNTHGVALAVHAGGSKSYVAPGNPSGAPAKTKGLVETIRLIARINGIGGKLDPPYRVACLKLQSMLSGNPNTREGHGLANNVVNAISFMKGVQKEFPGIRFVLGDALFQKRTARKDGGAKQTWRDAYRALKTALDEEAGAPGGLALNFDGIRLEWNRDWVGDPKLTADDGFTELTGPDGVLAVVHSYGWKLGISHNAERQSGDESFDSGVFESRVLSIARRSLDLGLEVDSVAFRNGGGFLFPETTVPEKLEAGDSPTQASVFLRLVALYGELSHKKR
ncbi:MAG: hypothetical protein HYY18_06130 [Planctomycetes bacterium]|nr:hypothetical protein [Planctomycetota bacterium]